MGVPKLALEKKAFQSYTLEEDRKERPDIVNVRLNKHERIMLEALKKTYNGKNDSTILKHFAFLFIKQQVYYDEIRSDLTKL